ncbi:hypothetical protein J23TS9_07320 [Paenibacillus sp. J23TS9]|uniref:hypothetical protein n=1 Tax=Paenibacillus sp. J23TS9 TaxID=2807193 RepID=UPI001B29340B|nr:hypothetical protein [Paenibacillus sp. J23TS9]GIP25602.1 hypothetical protein J23TS9_07320 [Paenibacillus sp. J23TS9]
MYTAEHSHSAYIARLMSSRPVGRLTAELAFELEEKLHQTFCMLQNDLPMVICESHMLKAK